VDANERDTRLMFRKLHNTARVLKNAVSDEVVKIENRPEGAKFEDIKHLVAGGRGRTALEGGDRDGGVITAGQIVGLINDIPTCKELIDRIVKECRTYLQDAVRKSA
jgi:nitronate monooxygenase